MNVKLLKGQNVIRKINLKKVNKAEKQIKKIRETQYNIGNSFKYNNNHIKVNRLNLPTKRGKLAFE